MNDLIADILAGTNAILALYGAIYGIMYLRKWRRQRRAYYWIKLLNCLLCLYWGGLYFVVLFLMPLDYNSIQFGRIYVRPAFTVTLAALAIGALHRYKTGE